MCFVFSVIPLTCNCKVTEVFLELFTFMSQKIPPEDLWRFSKTVGNCSTKFYMPITGSYLR